MDVASRVALRVAETFGLFLGRSGVCVVSKFGSEVWQESMSLPLASRSPPVWLEHGEASDWDESASG